MDFSLARIENALLKKEYKNIISNDLIFTELFCKEFIELDLGNDMFDISLNYETELFCFHGKNRVIDEILSFVDKIRILLNKSLNAKENISISFVEMSKCFYIKKTTDVIDLSSFQTTRKSISWLFFTCYIKPCISSLCEKLLITTNEKYINQSIDTGLLNYITNTYTIDIKFDSNYNNF